MRLVTWAEGGSTKIALHREADFAEVTVGDGSRGNALARADWCQLESVFHELARDEELRAVVVRGEGGTFSAGSDMREWARTDVADVVHDFAAMERAFTAIEELPVPVIAEVEGVAAGAGCQLALACDLRVFAETARIGMPIARLGILVSPAFAARLSVLAGPAVARELLYTGRLVTAEEALLFGLVTRCVPEGETWAATRELLLAITRHPDAAVRAAKRAVDAAVGPVRAAAKAQAEGAPIAYRDFQRGVEAFLARGPASPRETAAPPGETPERGGGEPSGRGAR